MTSVSEISRRLADRALSASVLLLPGGRQVKNEFHASGIEGGEGDSLKVHLDGPHVGEWRDWANQVDYGDMLDLWRLSRGLSPGEAVRQAKEWLGISDPVQRQTPRKYIPAPKKDLPEINPQGRAFRWLSEKRKILPETIAAFKLTTQTAYDDKPASIVFPSFCPTGTIVNRSYRSLPVGNEKKEVWQDFGCGPSLFGWHVLAKSALESRTVLLSEGQIDCMTWTQWGIPSLSIPNGGGGTWIDYEWDNLSAFEKIYIAFDMDEAGVEMRNKAIPRLGPDRCYIISMPHKDANDCLVAGCTAEDAHRWVKDAKAPTVTGLMSGWDLRERVLAEFEVKPMPFTLAFFNKNWSNQEGLYFRPAEVTLWTGHSHAGKSTFLNFLMISVISAHLSGLPRQSIFIGSFEVKPETTIKRMIVAYYGIMKHDLNANDWLLEYGSSLTLADVVGFIKQESLFEMMRFAFRRFGVMTFIVDSLMKIQGLEEDYPAQSDFVNELQQFAKSTGTHVHLVAHPRKGQAGISKPGLLDVKGNSSIPNGVDNVIAICRNMEKLEAIREGGATADQIADYDTEIRVEKQKDSGWVGNFYLRFNPRDYTFTPCQRIQKPKPEKPRYQKQRRPMPEY